MSINVPVKESMVVPEGKHTGEIVKVTMRTEPYEYVDVFVTVDGVVAPSTGEAIQLKEGFPAQVTPNSKLGRLLTQFGLTKDSLEESYGSDLDVETWIKTGAKVTFLTINKKTDRGTFARIVEDSIKPVE